SSRAISNLSGPLGLIWFKSIDNYNYLDFFENFDQSSFFLFQLITTSLKNLCEAGHVDRAIEEIWKIVNDSFFLDSLLPPLTEKLSNSDLCTLILYSCIIVAYKEYPSQYSFKDFQNKSIDWKRRIQDPEQVINF